MKIFCICIFFLLFINQSFAGSVDYNTNGITDFHLYGANNNNEIDHGLFFDDGTTSSMTFGNKKTDKIISGDFNGDNKSDIGIVRKKVNKILWQYRDINSGLSSNLVSFGSGTIKVLAGCDFNGNGKSEIAFIKDKILSYRDFDGKKRAINLPRNDYTYFSCADTNGDGKDEFVGKKRGISYFNGVKKKNLWGYDVVGRKSKVLLKQKAFGDSAQGGIVIADIDGNGKDEIGYIRNAGDKAFLVFLNNFKLNETTQYVIPRVVKKTGKFFDISRAFFSDGVGYIYKGIDKNVYKYNLSTNTDTTFILALSTPSNIKSGNLVNDVSTFNISGSSSGDGDSSSDIAGCDVVRGTGNGFLWKGRGESYGGVSVALLPVYTSASSCYVVAADNSKSEEMWCSAQSANPINGAGRQHWRAESQCSAFKKPSVLKCHVGNKWQCWKLEDPCKGRIE